MTATVNFIKDNNTRQLNCDQILTIGRSSSNDAVLPESKVSRSHAVIRRLGNHEYYLIDLGSANGTILNGERVVMPALLKNNDRISIGSSELVFTREEDETSDIERDDSTDCRTVTGTIQPDIRTVTVLVADIRGYTSLSERIPVATLARIVGRWFRSANTIVEQNTGVVDKFIGDAVMARWLVGDDDTTVAYRALRAAHELHEMTTELGAEFRELPAPLRIGVGINTGKAAVGVMVAGRMQEYTVLGDSVNIAFRLESSTKELGVDVVISRDAFDQRVIPPGLRTCAVKVKGREEAVNVCALTFADVAHLLESMEPPTE
jgi:adenylate cyclase